MQNLFVIIPGFGEKHVPEKIDILRKNLTILERGPWVFKLRVVIYTPDLQLPEDISSKVEVIRQPGYVGENLRKWCHPRELKGYDMVLMLLDDVELHDDIKWDKLLQDKQLLGIDIMSPSLALNSVPTYQYMFTKPNSIENYNITRFLEFFCYLMDVPTYEKYYLHLDPENPWMWGIDLLVHEHAKFRLGIANKMTMTHHFKGEAYSGQDPSGDMHRFLAKYGISIEKLTTLNPVMYMVF